MDVMNYSRLVPMVVPTEDADGREQWVVVLKGTFAIVPGQPAELDSTQEPVQIAARFCGEPFASSLQSEDDLAPYKPRSDVVVNALAHAPGERPSKSWHIRVQVGAHVKTLRVTGPRAWVKTLLGYELAAPQACLEVPIRYERAYGGTFVDSAGESHVLQENPVGVGYAGPRRRPTADIVIAPQIEDPHDPIQDIHRAYTPQGLLPLTRSWLPRRALVGTTDERWQTERAPRLPLDFDHAFYNCAHPDLIYPGYLRGDEAVVLDGLDHERLCFLLPGYQASIFTDTDPQERRAAVLDTLYIDVPARRLLLTWRCTIPDDDVEEILIHAARAAQAPTNPEVAHGPE